MQFTKPFSVVIPAAGTSNRMGSAKASLKLPDGASFVEKILSAYSGAGADPIVLVVNKDFDKETVDLENTVVVVNTQLDLGRIHSIRLGLKHVPGDRMCFVHNVDNPFVRKDLLLRLLESASGGTYVMPVFGGRGGHPVLLSKEVIGEIVNNDRLKDFREALEKFRRVEIACNNPEVLLNINTPEDYLKFIGDN
jgi:molybdenum cofactor cytidylyltransferase